MSERLSVAEINRLLEVTPADRPAGLRNRALFAVLFRSGRSIPETLGLTAVEAEAVELAPDFSEEIEAWLECRNELGIERWAPLFSTLEGKRLRPSYVQRLVEQAKARAAELPLEEEPEPSPPPPRTPAPPSTRAPRPPLALHLAPNLVGGLLGALLVAGGIAAGIALSTGSDRTTHPGRSTAPPTNGGGTPTTTGPRHTGAARLVFVPGQSYCLLQPENRLGFRITLANKGGEDAKNVAFVASERLNGAAEKNPRIGGLRVPANAPKLQTVVSYGVPPQGKVTACSVRIFSPAFRLSGEEIPLQMRTIVTFQSSP